jgi:antirestriction protein
MKTRINESEWFDVDWRTPPQTRDLLIEMCSPITTDDVQRLRSMAQKETDRRKQLPNLYVKCPLCYEYHGQLTNIDSLCERDERETAPMRYDFFLKKRLTEEAAKLK